MARYIDAEQLKRTIKEITAKMHCLVDFPEHAITKGYLLAIKHVIEDIDEMPTADVAEVCRCKDCIYYECGKSHTPYCNNIDGMNEPSENDFCSYGKRKENG